MGMKIDYGILDRPIDTTKEPRPKRETHPALSDAGLASEQARWDRFEQERKNRQAAEERFRTQREEREAATEAERQAVRDQAEKTQLDALTAELREGFFSVPGATEEAFKSALPALLDERRRQAALSRERLIRSPISGRQILG